MFLPFWFCRERIHSMSPHQKCVFVIICLMYCLNKQILAPEQRNPCLPSPCGPNSVCKTVNAQAVCSCVQGFVGMPPNCRPECIMSSECPLNQACVNQHCIDPCPGTCGLNTNCQVINHNPICICRRGYTGDPFTRCSPIRKCLNSASLWCFKFTMDF